MPIPFLLGAGAVAGGIVGVKKGLKAKENYEKAERIGKRAERNYKTATKNLEQSKKDTQNSFVELGKTRIEIHGTTIKKFISIYEKINNIKETKLNNGQNITIESAEYKEMNDISAKASDLLTAGLSGLGAGTLAGIGAAGLATTIGVASTGTAIGTLSGAAATNALLAWLGGGALAAGGWGMAGGMVVLGALVAGPALLIGGWIMESKSEDALQDARDYESEVDNAIAQINVVIELLNAIQSRVSEVKTVIFNINERLLKQLNAFEYIFNSKKDKNGYLNYENLNELEKTSLMNTILLTKTLNKVLNTPIVDDKGSLSGDSKLAVDEGNNILIKF